MASRLVARRQNLGLWRPNGAWKEPVSESIGEPVGEPRSRDQLEYLADTRAQQIGELQGEVERLRDWGSGGDANGANVALSSLLRIVSDNTASPRQRIRAASAILGYQVQDDGGVADTQRWWARVWACGVR